jgi:hypothetical protein
MLEALSVTLLPWLSISRFSMNWGIIIRLAVVVALVVVLIRGRYLTRGQGIRDRTLAFGAAFAAGYLALAVYYGSSSYAIWFYGRYMAPLVLVSALCLSLIAVRHFNALWLALLVALTAFACAATLGLWTTTLYPGNEMYTDQVALVESTVPHGETVAAGQTGTLGFFRDNVVNLDGKVNPRALAARGDIPGMLDELGIRWLCDWPQYVNRYFGEQHPGWTEVARKGNFVCLRRDSTQDS